MKMYLSCWLIVLLVLWTTTVTFAQDCFGVHTFVIQMGSQSSAPVLSNEAVTSLDECILRCKQDFSRCQAVNFKQIGVNAAPMCTLLEGRASEGSFQQNIGGMYYAEAVCLPSFKIKCNHSWAFELVPGVSLISSRFALKTFSRRTKEDCITECASLSDCRGSFYHKASNECKLSQIDRHSIRKFDHYFRHDSAWDLYENNCREEKMRQQKCQFIRAKGQGMTKIYDWRRTGVVKLEDCKEICNSWIDGICRSYTFDASQGICYLSHATSKSLREPFTDKLSITIDFQSDTIHTMEMGELDDCVLFELSCQQESMYISGQSMKLFTGNLQTRNSAQRCTSLVDNSFTFEAKINFNECGTKKAEWGTYSNLMFLKDGTTPLVTVRDKMVQVICRIYNGEDLTVTYELQVKNNRTNARDTAIVSPATPFEIGPKFELKILNQRNLPTDKVVLGEEGFLEIGFQNGDEELNTGIQVVDVFATDSKGANHIQLYDKDGCPVNDKVKVLERPDKNHVRARIEFFGFPDSAKVLYKGLVKPCIGQCDPLCTKQYNSSSNSARRFKRQSTNQSDSWIVSDTSYSVKSAVTMQERLNVSLTGTPEIKLLGQHSHEENSKSDNRAVRLPSLLNLLEPDDRPDYSDEFESDFGSSISLRKVKSPLAQCFTENLSCMVTVMLALLQSLLLLLCFCISFLYCKRMRLRRERNNAYSQMASGNPVQFVVTPGAQNRNGTTKEEDI